MQTLVVTDSATLFAALAQFAEIDDLGCVAANAMASTLQVSDTDRQAILSLLRKGYSCKAIAGELGVSVPTIKAQLMLLYRQTGRQRRVRQVEMPRHGLSR